MSHSIKPSMGRIEQSGQVSALATELALERESLQMVPKRDRQPP